MPVLGLELAAHRPRPAVYPAPGGYSGPGAYPGPRAYPGPGSYLSPAVAGRGRRALMLAVCCMILFIYRANVSPASVAQTTVEAFTGFLPVPAGFSSSHNGC